MGIKTLDESALQGWVESLIAHNRVIGIQAKEDRFAFDELSDPARLRLDYDVALVSPKQYFLPPRDDLLRFDEDGYESVFCDEPFVLFGVHPYDLVAINQMDRLFSQDNCDNHYMARREAATIIACDVQNPSENCFAGCMGTAVVKDGFDVLVTHIGEHYVAEARTEKGEEALALAGELPDAERLHLLARVQAWQTNRNRLRAHELKMDPQDLPELLTHSRDHEVWEEKAERCFSCGSCNLVCPTCYCFDVQDDANWDLSSGTRTRIWDGCMLESFAAVAGGHNFRSERVERYRHRYYRKGAYVPEMIGEIACVGCGRCITACVANIANPVEVFNRLWEEVECAVPAQTAQTSTSRS